MDFKKWGKSNTERILTMQMKLFMISEHMFRMLDRKWHIQESDRVFEKEILCFLGAQRGEYPEE